MTDPNVFAQAQIKINQVITQVHHLLSSSFTISEQARDLLPDQNAILQQLNEKSIEYKSLVGILAIDTYTSSLVERMKRFDDIQAIFSIHIQNILSLQRNHQQNFKNSFKRVISSLVSLTETFSQYYPESAYIQNHRKMLQSTNEKYKEENSNCYQRHIVDLRQENSQLKSRLKATDIQINKLELQLEDILKQQVQNQKQGYQQGGQGERELMEDNYERGNIIKGRSEINEEGIVNRQIKELKEVIDQLKSQIYTKQQQINRMNDQFTFQIHKYNTVFSELKSEVKQLRSYSSINYIRQIQRLQTMIVRMREQRQRDQLIIQQLKYSKYGGESRSSYTNSKIIPEMYQYGFKKSYSPKYISNGNSRINSQIKAQYPNSYDYRQSQNQGNDTRIPRMRFL